MSARRILLVGFEGADWNLILPLMDAGQMPAMASLVESGVMGNLATCRGQVAPALWTTIATGCRADRHGVLGYLEPTADGVAPADGRARRVPALWDRLSRRGLRSLVVGWPSGPAEHIDGVWVSPLLAMALGRDDDAPRPPLPRGIVEPPELAEELSELRIHPREISAQHLLPFVPGAASVDQARDARLAAIAVMLAQCTTLHACATALLPREPWALVAVHYDFIDRVSHAFMGHHPPALRGTSETDRMLYAGVVSEAYRHCDRMLGRLLALAGAETTVMVVSDHGFQHGAGRPPSQGMGRGYTRWHRDHGILVMSGPGIHSDEWIWGGGIADVAPTAVRLYGLPVGAVDGNVLTDALEAPPPEATGADPEPAAVPCPSPRDPREVELELLRLLDQGYLRGADVQGPGAQQRAEQDRRYNLALACLDGGHTGEAAALLARLHDDAPSEDRYTLELARCLQALGHLAAARALVEEVLGRGVAEDLGHRLSASLEFGEGDFPAALRSLFRAQQRSPADPTLHCHIGEVYLRLARQDDARRAFMSAVALDADYAGAWHGLAVTHLQAGDFAKAAEAALRAIGLSRHLPEAHYHLGVALAHLGQARDAARHFDRCLAHPASRAAAHAWLAHLHGQVLDDPATAARHRAVAGASRPPTLTAAQLEIHVAQG